MSILLDDNAIKNLRSEHHSWSFEIDGKAMNRELKFDGFPSAIAFIMQVAIIADKMNHHPEWSNVYSTVKIRLTTHDVGGITDLDESLAKKIDKIALQLGAISI